MAERAALHAWTREIAQRISFQVGQPLYEGLFYTHEQVRNVVYGGTYEGKPAVLKVYDEYRLTDEPRALEEFNRNNKSVLLLAPKVYASEIVHPKKGWLVMERLPEGGAFMQSPLRPEERRVFLGLYREYRRNFPATPWRKLTLVERLSADARILHSMARFLELANAREEESRMRGEEPFLPSDVFLSRYHRALELLREELKTRGSEWGHSHFKPKEIYRAPNDRFYLTDFAHATMHPEGYEMGFVIWADHLMGADWRQPYATWREGVFTWIEELRPLAAEFRISRFDDLIRANLIARVLGAMLADVTASDRPREEKVSRIALLSHLLDELCS